MSYKKTKKSWKDRSTVEKIEWRVGGCVVAVLMLYGVLPSPPEPNEPPQKIASEVQHPSAQHTHASAPALSSATQHLSQLDKAISEGMRILKTNQLSELATHSHVFKSLLDAGHAQFGRPAFEPLGHCTAAGSFANSWWGQAQLSAARRGGPESVPGAIQSSLDEYAMSRAECLKQADPSAIVASQH